MRKPIVAGNWKMNLDLAGAKQLAKAICEEAPANGCDVICCPPSTYIHSVSGVCAGSPVQVGGQNCHHASSGAFTGEISPKMLKDSGAGYCIIGHSERRHSIGKGEDDWFLNQKIAALLQNGVVPIFCIGETLEQRDAGLTERVLTYQLDAGLSGISLAPPQRLIIAYEPVWAIGTGKVASPEEAQAAHRHIRTHLAKMYPNEVQSLPILYGGSMKPDNALGLLKQPDIDGGLIGGASLKADDFLTIVRAALEAKGGSQ
ncbi:MAG: triose-phosphate isomerase [Phycisphaerae bacterium]